MIGKEIPVTFTSHGMQVIGILHRPPADIKPPAVVFYHGCTGSKTEAHWLFVKLARHLAARGLMVLRFDFRGSGDSEGEFEDMTISGEIEDGLRAFEYLKTECGADTGKIGILGLSMGGVVASFVAGRLKEQVSSCVLLNPVACPLEDFSFIARSRALDVSRFPVEYNSFLFGRAFFEELGSIRPLEEISRATCPVLVVNGSGDTTIAPHRSREYYDVLNMRPALSMQKPGSPQKSDILSELFILENADHSFASHKWEQAVLDKVGAWFENIFFLSQ